MGEANVNTVEQMAAALGALIDATFNTKSAAYRHAVDALAAYQTAKEREQQDERCMLHGERIRYNGYANYETWSVSLWIDNDQGEQEFVVQLVSDAGNVFDGAEAIRGYIDGMLDDHNPLENFPMFSDLLGLAISRVDWIEVARQHRPDEWGDSDTVPDVPSALTFDDSDYADE